MKKRKGLYERFLKRLIDIILSFLGIIILSPILVIISLLVFLNLGRPIIFKQIRPGKNGNLFTMYKFRSMNEKKSGKGQLLSDEHRLTKLGKFLRATSLDELPELFNILFGSMSIVGPRPQLVKDLVFMSEVTLKRHNVTPGLTGLAQVSGRNDISWEKKFELDLEYISNISFHKDIQIILLTIRSVLKKEGLTSEGLTSSEDYGDYLLKMKSISKEEFMDKVEKSNKIIKDYKGQKKHDL